MYIDGMDGERIKWKEIWEVMFEKDITSQVRWKGIAHPYNHQNP